ncbi:MAG: M48 family metallopeptidase [Nitrospirota bacterium]|nr:MAG: M48 family metallopeptidase [Nitrospirota bacterium]
MNITIEGRYYDGTHPVSHPATLSIAGSEALLSAGDVSRTYHIRELRVTPRVGVTDRFINFPDGWQFHCADRAFLDRLPQEIKTEGVVAWLEQRIAVALISVILIVASLTLGYVYGVPAAAESIVKKIPIETEKALGTEVIAWLDDNMWFTDTHISEGLKDSIRDGFEELYTGLEMDEHYDLAFRSSEVIGPNAFALPGGTIVITDQLIHLADTDDEILAILAHEIGHIEKRHTMRQILQSSAVGVAVATITGDAASLSVAVTGLPMMLAQTKFSREFEAEADEFAFELLKEHDIDPDAFATLMEKLVDDEEDKFRQMSFISSHPLTSDRIKAAREASEEEDEED